MELPIQFETNISAFQSISKTLIYSAFDKLCFITVYSWRDGHFISISACRQWGQGQSSKSSGESRVPSLQEKASLTYI